MRKDGFGERRPSPATLPTASGPSRTCATARPGTARFSKPRSTPSSPSTSAGIIDTVNPATERLFGYSPAELIGANVNMLMPSPHRESHDTYLENYRRTGHRKIIGIGREVTGRRKDGGLFPMDLSVSEIVLAGRRMFMGLVHDVTDRKRAEECSAQCPRRLGTPRAPAHGRVDPRRTAACSTSGTCSIRSWITFRTASISRTRPAASSASTRRRPRSFGLADAAAAIGKSELDFSPPSTPCSRWPTSRRFSAPAFP